MVLTASLDSGTIIQNETGFVRFAVKLIRLSRSVVRAAFLRQEAPPVLLA